jgi:hypothetical protein
MIRSDKNSTITLMKYVAMSEVAKLKIALTILLKLYFKISCFARILNLLFW